MRKLLLLVVGLFLFAKDISFDGYISKITFNRDYLVAGLENGEVHIKNFKSLKLVKKISLPNIEDFMGDKIAMPIYSLDIMDNKVLILGEGSDSVRVLYIYDIKTDKLSHIFTSPTTYMKAKFIDENTILFGLLSDEVSLYNLKEKKIIYTKSVGNYVFSTMALNSPKTEVVFGDESGAVKLVDISTGNKKREFSNFNKDQTISIAFMNRLVVNASSDKRVSLIDIKTGRYLVRTQTKFLPYGAAISPSENYFAVQYDEKNNIAVFDKYGKIIKLIKGQTMPLNGMRFIDDNRILSYSADKVMISKIKE